MNNKNDCDRIRILGYDIGTNSIGWSILERSLNDEFPIKIIASGCLIYQDGRDEEDFTSLAVNRRTFRHERRQRRRKEKRKKTILNFLLKNGLYPSINLKEFEALHNELKNKNVYELRNRAINEKLELYEIGRVFINLSQKRGFRSSRRVENDKKDEVSKILPLIENLKRDIQESGADTLGQFYYLKKLKNPSFKIVGNPLYHTTREMYEKEIDLIIETQSKFYADLNKDIWKKVKNDIFYQRTLKAPIVGKCIFFREEDRHPTASPWFQKFRILQDVLNLKIVSLEDERDLTLEERKLVFNTLLASGKASFASLRKLLDLEKYSYFNLESETRKELKGDTTGALLSDESYFGKEWFTFDIDKQEEIYQTLDYGFNLNYEEEIAKLFSYFKSFGLDDIKADNLAKLNPAKFEKGYCRFSIKALKQLVQYMGELRLGYNNAVVDLGLESRILSDVALSTHLDYYGKILYESVVRRKLPGDPTASEEDIIGRISNPTVHIAFNQVRKLTNILIDKYGRFDGAVVEIVGGIKQGAKQRKETIKTNKKNKEENEDMAVRLKNELGIVSPSRRDIQRVKLWKEAKETCIYSGKKIPFEKLFSPEVQENHILPYFNTLDDSMSNRVVVLTETNKYKDKSKTPYQAFCLNETPYDYNKILYRAKRTFSINKFRRFTKFYHNRCISGEWLSRQINDTAYISKLMRRYLSQVIPETEILCMPSFITKLIRDKFNLNGILYNLPEENKLPKNRRDLRHNVIDAIVLGTMTKSYLKTLVTEINKNSEEATVDTVNLIEPCPNFKNFVEEQVRKTIVMHRPYHSTNVKFFAASAYGYSPDVQMERNGKPRYALTIRKPVTSVTTKNFDRLVSNKYKKDLEEIINSFSCSCTGKKCEEKCTKKDDIEKAIAAYFKDRNIKKVKFIEPYHNLNVIDTGISKKYLHEDEIHHINIWKLPDGSKTITSVNSFQAGAKKEEPKPHREAKKLMKLYKQDMLRIKEEDKVSIYKVLKLHQCNEKIEVLLHCDGTPSKDKDGNLRTPIGISFKKLLSLLDNVSKVNPYYV